MRRRPTAPMTSIQQFEAPSDAAEPAGAPDDAVEADPMAEQRAAEPARTHDESDRRPGRVRPSTPRDDKAAADLQTTAGVPKKPIPEAAAGADRPAEPDAPAEPQATAEPKTGAEPEAAAEPEQAADPERASEPKTAEKPDQSAKRTTAREPGQAAEPRPTAEPETAEPKTAEPKTAEPKTAEPKTAEPKTADEPELEAGAETVAEPEADEPDKNAAQVPEAEADDATTADPDATAVMTLPEKQEKPEPEDAGDPDRTMVIRAPDADDTVVIATAGAAAKDEPGPDDTVVISAPDVPGPDDTVVILSRPADETVMLTAATVAPPTEVATAVIPVVPGRGGKRTTAAAPADPGRVPKPARPRREPLDLGHAPAVLTISALGVLMVALAYAGGRVSTGNAQFAYWVGQVVVFTPVVVRLLSRRMAGAAESFLLVMGLALHQYLLKWMYSPDQFRFPDELQHWLATTIIVQTGELFQPNPALPPAVHFPGLAELGAAATSMTGLPVTAAGVVVAGVAHLAFVAVLFSAVLRASNSPAVAGVCCATYATALHYLFFNSMFLYQTAALPFFMLAIWAARRWRTEGGWPFLTLAVCCAGLTTVSHHVTAFALVLTLTLLAVVELVVQKPRRWSALVLPAVAAVVVAAWLLTVARDVVGYLEAPVDQVVQTVSDLVNGRSQASSTTAAVSVGQLVVQGTGLLGLFVLYVALVRDMIQRHDRDVWRWSAVVGGAIFFAGNGVRFLGQNGPEIAGRLSTFTYVPISILAAIALVRGVQIIPARDAEGHRWRAAPPAIDVIAPGGWNLYSRVAAGAAMITLLMIGARAGGWPPLGSILPGPYLAGGFERSVDAYGVATADWQRRALGPGNRVGGDVTSVSLASTYGRQDPVREVGPLYYADQWGLTQQQMVDDLAIQYLVVDRRLSEQLPEGEAYFENDPNAGSITRPLTTTQIAKFDSLAGVDRLYDNGTVRVYRMGAP